MQAVEQADRLVLLGDVIELRHGPLGEALSVARPVLRELGEAARDRDVVLVPGNHDHMLLRGWFERRALEANAIPLGLESEVDWRDGELLDAVVGELSPARVRITYPGIWLRDDVYATHGHYGDRHNTAPIIERLGAGAMARLVPERDGGPQRAEDYETILRPMYAWIEAVAQGRVVAPPEGHSSVQVEVWRELTSPGGCLSARRAGLRAAFPLLIAALNHARLGPLGADVSGPELRRGGLRGIGQVVARLGIGAGHVLFGHTHRAGPLEGDRAEEWVTPTGTRLLNVGSWTIESSFIGSEPRKSPYRPGFCAVVEEEGPPQLRNLLDAVTAPAPA